jgi:hypothetical protein
VAGEDVAIGAGERPKSISVDLVGQRYEIVPPKAGIALRIAKLATDKDPNQQMKVLSLVDVWIARAFGDQAPELERRMYEDPDDELDFPHVVQLIQKVVEFQTGNPTS